MKLDTYQNPLLTKLIDEVYINTSISSLRGDIESILYGLSKIDETSRLYKDCRKKVDNFILTNNVTTTNIKTFLLAALFLGQDEKIIDIRKTLSDLIKSAVYPIGEKAHILYLIQDSKKFENESIALVEVLLKKSEELKRRNRLNILVQSTFSLISDQFKTDYEKFIEEKLALENILSSPSELVPIYKACLYLRRNFPNNLTVYNSRIEEIIRKISKVNQSPEIWFAISESEKIINSNLGKDIDTTILNLLKENNIEWAQWIKDIQNDSITISINQQFRLTRMSSYDIFYATEFLSAEGRDNVVTIPANKKEEYLSFLRNTSLATDKESIIRLIIFFLILGVFMTINILSSIDLIKDYIDAAVQVRLKPKSIEDIFILLSNPIVWSVILAWWAILAFNQIKNPYSNSLSSLLKLFPIYLYIHKFFTSIKPL